MSKKRSVVFISAGVIIVLIGALLIYDTERGKWIEKDIAELGLKLSLPLNIDIAPIEIEERRERLVFRAREPKQLKNKSPFLVTVQYEDGLRMVTAFSRQDLLSVLARNFERGYAQKFNKYEKLSEIEGIYEKRRGIELQFLYENQRKELMQQRLLILPRDGDTAIYIAAQAREKDFERINKKYFERMFKSIDFRD